MKRLIILIPLIICLFLTAPAQYKYKAQYRDKPQKGEILSVVGIILMGASASNLVHKTTFKNAVTYTGGAMVCLGVVIDIKGNKRRNTYRRR